MDQVVTNRFPSRTRWGCGFWWAAARQPAYFQARRRRRRLGSVLTETDRNLKRTSSLACPFECVTVWQFVTLWWFHVHCIVTRYSHYCHCVWHKCMIHLWYFHVDLPVSSGYLPSFVEEPEEKDVLAQLSLDQLLKDDTESVATKSTDMSIVTARPGNGLM